ncbi:3-keto-5-aminohexanoate cleavage protein [Parasedimentitalea huanghaiensis]|uniref:3-keto-5-aminohexanoate cleavage protein n=1 Tax=Parasedimentitalea huanghaiensis TaxID=2682100 RepID=A0A6L6WLB6_9RHOB|nr:3-keto-5-aminohexanoate cleavage protein [Zongyanglinia huanghaiensis]MVO18633.1 3-keto-5-aminohexanoate cleavage protein [Zongyanglinia huanghaiensis]
MTKILISCAITGSIHTPSMSPYLPITPDEIIEHGLGAAEAGASVLHLHARNPKTGQPSSREQDFMAFLPRLKQATDAVLNISTGGSATMTLDDRLTAPKRAEPEMCSLNMGSMNFALYPAAERITDWKHDWEKPFLENSDDLVFKNTPRDMARILFEMGTKRGARFEFECYDIGHLYMLKHFVDRGLVQKPLFIQFVFGVLGGMGPDPENLMHMKIIADKLFGESYMFSVLAAGRHQIPLITMAATMGGHVRVGLEDSLMISRGILAKTNAEQVFKIRRIVEELGREVATPNQAREMLGLKGADRTAI